MLLVRLWPTTEGIGQVSPYRTESPVQFALQACARKCVDRSDLDTGPVPLCIGSSVFAYQYRSEVCLQKPSTLETMRIEEIELLNTYCAIAGNHDQVVVDRVQSCGHDRR